MERHCPRCGAVATHPTLCRRCGAQLPPDTSEAAHRGYRRLWVVTLIVAVVLFAICVVLAYSTTFVVTGS